MTMILTCQHCQKRCSWFKKILGRSCHDNPYLISFYSLSLRVFADPSNPEKMWKASVKDIDGEILCVSQFTLLANTTKGNKPDFHRAMVKLPYLLTWRVCSLTKGMWRLRSRRDVSMPHSWMPLRCLIKQTKYKASFFLYTQLDLTSPFKKTVDLEPWWV